jgi:hypothetical protein
LPTKSLFHLCLLGKDFGSWFVFQGSANCHLLCVADMVPGKAGRFPRTHHEPPHGRHKLVEVAWWNKRKRGG